ncbi:acyl-CoA thioesterase domain-containing protein [Acrocarpospora sp. B8E8]|uniref:acyl-CoA thioesterase n=1 Tax=Acrocarpospora sp. B8E8 TaxID=3153572 RepID=UPI00325DEE00
MNDQTVTASRVPSGGPGVPLLSALTLEETGPGRYRATNVPSEQRAVIFGGQLLGQLALAAAETVGTKSVRSIQALFARAGSVTRDLAIRTEVVHDGRTMGSVLTRAHQGDRTLCTGLVLLDTEEPDLIRHAEVMPAVPDPEGAEPVEAEHGSELRLVGGRAILSAEHTGPAEVHAWARFPCAPRGAADLHRALLCWYTDGLLIGTAMRPHPLGQDMAHQAVSTGVLTHTITFHEECDASEWMLITQKSTYAGNGRCYGTGAVFTASGVLLASFAQEGMIRAFPPGRPRGGTSMTM